MSGLAIVAIPPQDDYVWKISSEKVPHLTLLFLGEQDDNPNLGHMEEYLQHVVETSMCRFGLDVERRGLLGDKDADVLFFRPSHIVKNLVTIRRYLLNDQHIAAAYNSTEQFPTWTPHLTLGYPETPAKPDNRDYPGISWVNFDRISLWIGDYEGPEFELKDRLYSDEMAMSELAHYGVKGMKWGVRNDREGGVYRLQAAGPKVDSTLPQSTKTAGQEVASLIGKRYNFHISELKAIEPGHPEYDMGTIGFVQSTPGQRGGVIYASRGDVRKPLKDAEDIGWFGKGCGNTRGFLTHESAHAIFHAEQQVKPGLLGSKVVGGNIKARDKALKAAMKEAKREGVPSHLFSSKVSDYAATSGTREELEAELFSQYHWGSNPPQFVRVWGETLHRELGVDDTPFREEV